MAAKKPKIVFIDTEQFDARGLSFSHPIFQRLSELVESGLAKVLITDVVVGEVRRHIREKLADARGRLGKDFGGLFKNLTKVPTPQVFAQDYWDNAEAEALAVFDACCKKMGATVIPISKDHVGPVFQWYFSYESPFDKHKRKSEFPDAFSIAAVKGWADEHGQDVYAITGDAAFSMAGNPSRLTHIKTLAEFFESFPDSEVTKALKLGFKEFLDDEANYQFGQKEFQGLDFYVEDAGFAVEDVTLLYTEPYKVHVIEAANGHAVLAGKLYVHFMAYIPSLSTYIEDDTAFVDAEVVVEYDEGDPTQITVVSVSYERSDGVEVSLPAKYRRNSED